MTKLQEQFSQIYDRYIGKIYRFIYFKVNSSDIAQDISSETFSRGWLSFQKANGAIKKPSSLLYRIARNLVTDYYRQKSKIPRSL